VYGISDEEANPIEYGINASHGIEIFYSIEVTWLHISPDLRC